VSQIEQFSIISLPDSHLPNEESNGRSNERSLNVLLRSLNLSKGYFSLIVVNCNYRSLRQQILTGLAAKFTDGGLMSQEIWWSSPAQSNTQSDTQSDVQSDQTLYQKLQTISRAGLSDNISALMCLGLEQINDQKLKDFFLDANLFRDRLKRQINCPIVLWLSDRELRQFYVHAPELVNLASTPIKFSFSPSELNQRISQQVERVFEIAIDAQVPLFWQDTKIDAELDIFFYNELETARKELQLDRQYNSGGSKDELHSETLNETLNETLLELNAKLDFEQGRLFWRSPEAKTQDIYEESEGKLHSVSQIYYQCSLSYWRQVERSVECGIVLFYLGNLWWYNSFLSGRPPTLSCDKAKQFFKEAMAAFRKANREDLIAKYGRTYSLVLSQLNQWDELEQWIKYLLPLHQPYSLELAQDLGYLAKIAVEKKEWLQVRGYAEQALSILNHIPPHFDNQNLAENWLRWQHIQSGEMQLLLVQSYLQLSELDLAAILITKAISNFNRTYDPKLYIRLLDTSHDIAFAQGRYLDAFHTRKKQRSLEQQYGLRAFIGAGVLQPKQLSPSPTIAELDASKFDVTTSEIQASGRDQDVEKLVERILSIDNYLTIIHGESGVGKSSLVNAGLIPALLQRSHSRQILLPIQIRNYTDWGSAMLLQLSQNFVDRRSDRRTIPSVDINPDQLAKRILDTFKQITGRGTQIILIFDQFEEFFFDSNKPLKDKQNEKQIFINFWQSCLKIPLLKLVVSIREDYLHSLLELESSRSHIDILSRDFRYAIKNFSQDQARSLIENLTKQANFPLEEILVDALVEDLASDRLSVRPIELQLVGSQLQTHNINTLSAYQASGGKQRLVEQSVEEVIRACGNAAFVAQQVLVLLTDDQGKRPLQNYSQLQTGLLPYCINDPKLDVKLDLVLEILTGSGLISQVSEGDNQRYQLVHDYLVAFIRANQESGLIAELQKARFSEQISQTRLDHLTKFALSVSIVGLFVMGGLAFNADRQRQIAEIREIKALVSSATSNFALNEQLEALTTILQSAKKWKNTDSQIDRKQVKKLNFEALQTIVYNMREQYRFGTKNDDSPIYTVKSSPDGKMIAYAGYDGSIYLSNINGEPITELTAPNIKHLREVSFSPDSQRIASVGQGDRNIRIWDIATKKLVNQFYAHDDDIHRVSFHPDGKRILTGSKDGTVKIWDSDRGTVMRIIDPPNNMENIPIPPNQKPQPITDASFSPDGKMIVTAKGEQISVWDLQGNLLTRAITDNKTIFTVKFHPSGKLVASSDSDRIVKLWRITDATTRLLTELITGSSSNNPRDGELQLIHKFEGRSNEVLSLDFSKNGKQIAFGYQDGSVQITDLAGDVNTKIGNHRENVFDVTFSQDDRTLVSASKDRSVRLWTLQNALIDSSYGHTDNIWAVSYRPDGKVFASASVDKSIRLWNADGSFKQELSGHSDIVYSAVYSADGTKLVSASRDGSARIWDGKTGTLLNVLKDHGAELIYATFSRDQKTFATVGFDNKIKLWQWNDTDNPKLLKVLDGHTKLIWSISFSPDGQTIASTSNDETIRIWDVKNGQNLHTIMNAHKNGGLAIAFSPNGKQIASAGKDSKLKLWNAQSGASEQEIIVDDKLWIFGISYHPNGKAIAIANADKTIKIFDVDTGELLKTLTGHRSEVNALAYSPDGKYLISGSRDTSIKRWNAETLNFDQLMLRGCSLLENYLKYNKTVSSEQKQICNL
jgi:WD40 repeat protein